MGLLVGEEEEEWKLERRGKAPALGALRGSWVGTPGRAAVHTYQTVRDVSAVLQRGRVCQRVSSAY